MKADEKRVLPAQLALADGTVFRGIAWGAEGETAGEVVFNTSMSGYQEILTDPSYAYQMLTFTCPHIGNVGVNDEDVESSRVHVSGVIMRELPRRHSNFRAQRSLDDYLRDNGIVGIAAIDTRELVLHIRRSGAQMGVIASGEGDADELVDKARCLPSMAGLDLAKDVSCKTPFCWSEGGWQPGLGYRNYSDAELKDRPLVIAVDYGIKRNILRLLLDHGFRVKVVPASYSAPQILAESPDGVFLSNGPGDPAAVTYGIETVRGLVGKKPIFGICLGHQILGLAVDAPTYKLKFGHRGGNHPVKNLSTGLVEITVQNHGFATELAKVPAGVRVTHMNLNDQTVEGLKIPGAKAFSVQYHPESSPGPSDAKYLFQSFIDLVSGKTGNRILRTRCRSAQISAV